MIAPSARLLATSWNNTQRLLPVRSAGPTLFCSRRAQDSTCCAVVVADTMTRCVIATALVLQVTVVAAAAAAAARGGSGIAKPWTAGWQHAGGSYGEHSLLSPCICPTEHGFCFRPGINMHPASMVTWKEIIHSPVCRDNQAYVFCAIRHCKKLYSTTKQCYEKAGSLCWPNSCATVQHVTVTWICALPADLWAAVSNVQRLML